MRLRYFRSNILIRLFKKNLLTLNPRTVEKDLWVFFSLSNFLVNILQSISNTDSVEVNY